MPLHMAAGRTTARTASRPHARPRTRAFRRRSAALALAAVPLLAVTGTTPASAATGEYTIGDICSLSTPAIPAQTVGRSGTWMSGYDGFNMIGCGWVDWDAHVFEGISHAPISGSRMWSRWQPGLPITKVAVRGQSVLDYSTGPWGSNPANNYGGWEAGVTTGSGGTVKTSQAWGHRTIDTTIDGGRSTYLETYAACNNPGGVYAGTAYCIVPGVEENSAIQLGREIESTLYYWIRRGSAAISPTLADDYAPRATISQAPSGDWTGDVALQFSGSDRMPGSGVQRAAFVVDGDVKTTADLSRGTPFASTCNPSTGTFAALQPCPEEGTAVFGLDTAQLVDGTHTVNAIVTDASGRSATVIGWPRDIVTANKPVLTSAPVPTGRIQVGNAIAINTGSWSTARAPRGFRYQWSLDGQAIDGETQPTLIPTLDWAYHELSVTVTALNTGGATSTTVPLGRVADAKGFTSEEEARRDAEERRGGSGGGTPPLATSLPGITGTFQVGRGALAASVGGWTGATSHDVRWWRCARNAQAFSESACSPVGSGLSYTLGADDAYLRIVIAVTGRNDAGTATSFSPVTTIIRDKDGLLEPREDRSTGGGRTGGNNNLDDVKLPGVQDVPPGVAARVVPVWPAGITNLVNPLAERGHVPNGTNATTSAKWSGVKIKISKKKSASSAVGKAGRRWTIVGRLTSGSKAIGGATINIITDAGGTSTATGTVKTASNGTFKAVVSAPTSRSVRVAYFAFGDSAVPAISSPVKLGAWAPTKIGVGARVARNGGTIRITGSVGTRATAKAGTVVSVQLKQAGYKWMPIGTASTDAKGKWSFDYGVRKGLPPRRVSIRAVIPGQTGGDYARTDTKSVAVSIR